MKILKECLLIVLVSCLCGFLFNAFSPKGIALIGEWDTSKGVISAVSKSNPVIHDLEINDVATVKKIFDSGSALFVDARDGKAFAAGHIKGAVSLPAGMYEERLEPFLMKYPLSTSIVTYCSGRECEDSHDVAQILLQFGYENVRVFIDGFPAWKKNGFPIEKGADGSEKRSDGEHV